MHQTDAFAYVGNIFENLVKLENTAEMTSSSLEKYVQ